MRQASTRASRIRETGDPKGARNADDREPRPLSPSSDRPADRSAVGWRYGSALAAARALNARPAEA